MFSVNIYEWILAGTLSPLDFDLHGTYTRRKSFARDLGIGYYRIDLTLAAELGVEGGEYPS